VSYKTSVDGKNLLYRAPPCFGPASEGTLSRWFRLRLQLAPTTPQRARVVGYVPFSLWVIHKEGLCPSSGDVNSLMMMVMKPLASCYIIVHLLEPPFRRHCLRGQ
jgi:hypothetical protein